MSFDHKTHLLVYNYFNLDIPKMVALDRYDRYPLGLSYTLRIFVTCTEVCLLLLAFASKGTQPNTHTHTHTHTHTDRQGEPDRQQIADEERVHCKVQFNEKTMEVEAKISKYPFSCFDIH